jgi:hypothetical protein
MSHTIRYATIGEVSSGTLLTEDLLSSFSWELNYLMGKQSTRFPRKDMRRMIRAANKTIESEECDSKEAGWLLEEIQDALGSFAPPYAYFGANEGDGSCFGFWIGDIEDIEQSVLDGGGLVVDAGDGTPRGFTGEVLSVTDHGNVSLYVVNSRGKWREIWGVA